ASTGGLKGLILDLRGNPGGIFKSAVSVADLFLSEGIIVISQSPFFKEYNRTFKAEGVNPLLVPMVVLVDGETASAAEVVAGALKERSGSYAVKVVGQTTYGKGSIQGIITLDKGPLEKSPGGTGVGVAKWSSPSGQPYSAGGLTREEEVDVEGAAGLERAKEQLAKLLKPMAMSVPMAMR